jgi:hypothetical protein
VGGGVSRSARGAVRSLYHYLLSRLGRLRRQAAGRALQAQDDVEMRLARVEASLNRLETLVKETHELVGRRGALTQFYHIQQGLNSVIRRLYLDADGLPYPERLTARRFRLLSQNGEDGITYALFERIGTTNRVAVELGSGSNGGNSGFLISELGWTGLLVDADEQKARRLRSVLPPSRALIRRAWITRETVNELIRSGGFAGEIDFMGIDVDGIDYWLWEALSAVTPRVLVIEFNSAFGPDHSVVVPYRADFDRHRFPKLYFGASLGALVKLGQRRGYRLVAVEPRGVNAFFVRDDVANGRLPRCRVEEAYRLLEKYEPSLAPGEPDVVGQLRSRGLELIEV